MTDHVEELLPEYIDGALEPDDRGMVEAHLASCSSCREEATLAAEARAALAALPEVPVPFGTTERILHGVQRRPRFASPFAWRAAGLAAAAAAVVGVGIYITGLPGPREQSPPTAERKEPFAPAIPETDVQTGAPEAAEGAFSSRAAAYPRYEESQTRYTPENLTEATRQFATEAAQTLSGGFPPTAQEFYAGYDLASLPQGAQTAVACVNRGVPPDRTVVPLVVEAARFNGTPAYLVVYLRGAGPQTPYDRIQVVVVDRERCGVMHFALQRL